jgi:hypothetical protein
VTELSPEDGTPGHKTGHAEAVYLQRLHFPW